MNIASVIYLVVVALLLWLGAVTVGGQQASAAPQAERGGQELWQYSGRVPVYNSPRRARYPALARTPQGMLVGLFTRQSREQEAAGVGDMVAVYSHDDGQSWSRWVPVYEGITGEPRCMNTLTTLRSGRLVAAMAELDNARATSTIRLLTSDVCKVAAEELSTRTAAIEASIKAEDAWQVSPPIDYAPLVWAAPCSRLIEMPDGTLVMPVFGASSQADLEATIHGCGLLRSRDGGQSWGEFSWIAEGNAPIIGAIGTSRFSFEGPAVLPLADGRWLATITARRLGEGPGAPHVLCRSYSSDEGRTWSVPNQLRVGAWPCLAPVDEHTTVCADAVWSEWASMRMMVSYDGFNTFRQELHLMQFEWISGWNRVKLMEHPFHEAPLPPTVPHLGETGPSIPAGTEGPPLAHFGFPSALALDKDHLLVLVGRTQRGSGQLDPENIDIPKEQERIDAIFCRRLAAEEQPASQPVGRKPVTPEGRWVLAERFTTQPLFCVGQLPDGDLLALVEGGFIRSSDGGYTWQQIEGIRLPGPEVVADYLHSEHAVFAVLRSGRWLFGRGSRIWYSDDQGKSWLGGGSVRVGEHGCNLYWSKFIESPDGTVSVPADAILPEQDHGCVVVRSHDGGETWGDFSIVFRPGPEAAVVPEPASYIDYSILYSEMDIAVLPDGRWLAYVRWQSTQSPCKGPLLLGVYLHRSISSDQGRTWSEPEYNVISGGQHRALVLPNGGLAFVTRSSSWQGTGLYVTYDAGRSYHYALAGPYSVFEAFLHRNDELVVFADSGAAARYRWVPGKP